MKSIPFPLHAVRSRSKRYVVIEIDSWNLKLLGSTDLSKFSPLKFPVLICWILYTAFQNQDGTCFKTQCLHLRLITIHWTSSPRKKDQLQKHFKDKASREGYICKEIKSWNQLGKSHWSHTLLLGTSNQQKILTQTKRLSAIFITGGAFTQMSDGLVLYNGMMEVQAYALVQSQSVHDDNVSVSFVWRVTWHLWWTNISSIKTKNLLSSQGCMPSNHWWLIIMLMFPSFVHMPLHGNNTHSSATENSCQ